MIRENLVSCDLGPLGVRAFRIVDVHVVRSEILRAQRVIRQILALFVGRVDPGPTKEGVARTRRCSGDVDRLIDLQAVVGFNNPALTLGVVVVPSDVRRSLNFLITILGAKLDGVGGIRDVAILIDLVDNLVCIRLQNRELAARIHVCFSVNELLAIPRLEHPVQELLA